MKQKSKKKKRKNNILLVAVCSLLLLSVLGTGIYAYLSDSDKADNKFTIGGNRIEIQEDFQPPEEIVPGVEFKKDVTVTNVGLSDCFIRIKAVFTDSDMGKYCTVDFNASEDANDRSADYWYNAADGFYYYKKVLKQGDVTESLFTKVKVSEDIPAAEIKGFDILVYAESYQAGDFDNYMDAWEHYHRNKPST